MSGTSEDFGAVPIPNRNIFILIKSIFFRLQNKLFPKKSNFMKWVENEIKLSGLSDKDSDYGGMMGRHLLKMAKEFDKEGHSGMSASWSVNLLNNLLRWKPITPLTGKDDEWEKASASTLQNKRCSSVFKDISTGECKDIDGIYFKAKNGCTFSSGAGKKVILFPYFPGKPICIEEGSEEAKKYPGVFGDEAK